MDNGLCECGCGGHTKIAPQTNSELGWVKGEPIRFIRGHAGRHPLWDRFWPKVEFTGFCWNWTGGRSGSGYGKIWDEGHLRQAHRVAYELLVGPIPGGLDLDHLCRNHRCVNPDHLEPVSRSVNTLRGQVSALKGPKMISEFCRHGHWYTTENTLIRSDGCRECRACNREKARRYYQRQHDRQAN